jgi:hypothetical protein
VVDDHTPEPEPRRTPMAEVILSDVTIMRDGYCVIALEQIAPDSFCSVRPRPLWGFAWRPPFPHRRGDVVICDLRRVLDALPPHVEDLLPGELKATGRKTAEMDLIRCLRQAEFAENLHDLFGADLHTSGGGNAWVIASEAKRSICACRYKNIWFQLFHNAAGLRLRAKLGLYSGESLRSIPVVDMEWQRFVEAAFPRGIPAGEIQAITKEFNRALYPSLRNAMRAFARIGLAREDATGKCWLMLDSLFPQPQKDWLDRVRRVVASHRRESAPDGAVAGHGL